MSRISVMVSSDGASLLVSRPSKRALSERSKSDKGQSSNRSSTRKSTLPITSCIFFDVTQGFEIS